MKKLSDKLFLYSTILVLVLLSVFGIVHGFGGIETIKLIGGGSLIIGIIKIPFYLFGGVQLLRGVFHIIGKDTELFSDDGKFNYPLWILYIGCTLAGIVCFIDTYYKIR